MSKIAEMAKANYPDPWNKTMIRKLVEKGRITEEEYKENTGEDYDRNHQQTHKSNQTGS